MQSNNPKQLFYSLCLSGTVVLKLFLKKKIIILLSCLFHPVLMIFHVNFEIASLLTSSWNKNKIAHYKPTSLAFYNKKKVAANIPVMFCLLFSITIQVIFNIFLRLVLESFDDNLIMIFSLNEAGFALFIVVLSLYLFTRRRKKLKVILM